MAVKITALQLAARIQLGDGETALEEPTAGIVDGLLATATAMVEKYAATAPDAVQDTAVVRIAGWLYDSPNAAQGRAFAHALENSGAAGLLAQWRTRRARAIGDTT